MNFDSWVCNEEKPLENVKPETRPRLHDSTIYNSRNNPNAHQGEMDELWYSHMMDYPRAVNSMNYSWAQHAGI